jgi:hypothetical protein
MIRKMEIIQSTPDKWDYFKGKILKLEKNFSKKIRTDKNTHKEIFLDNEDRSKIYREHNELSFKDR